MRDRSDRQFAKKLHKKMIVCYSKSAQTIAGFAAEFKEAPILDQARIMAKLAFCLGFVEEARTLYKKIVLTEEQDLLTLAHYAHTLEAEDPERIPLLEKITATTSTAKNDLFAKSMALHDLRKYAEALATICQIKTELWIDEEIHLFQGLLFAICGDFKKAITTLKKVESMMSTGYITLPDDETIQYQGRLFARVKAAILMAEIYKKQNKYVKALDQLNEIREWPHVASLLWKQVEILKEITAVYPNRIKCFIELAKEYEYPGFTVEYFKELTNYTQIEEKLIFLQQMAQEQWWGKQAENISHPPSIHTIKKQSSYFIQLNEKDFKDNTHHLFIDHHTKTPQAYLQLRENGMVFSACGEKFKLKIANLANHTALLIDNKEGEVELSTDIVNTKPFYLKAQAKNFSFAGNITTNSLVTFETTDTLHLHQDTVIACRDDIILKSKRFECDALIITTKGNLNIQTEVIKIAKNHTTLVEKNITIRANHANIAGKLFAYQSLAILLAGNLYLHSNSFLNSKEKLILSFAKGLITDHARIEGNAGFIQSENKLTTDKSAQLKFELLTLTVYQFDHYAKMTANRIVIQINKALVNHLHASIKSGGNIYLLGENIWSAGDIIYGTHNHGHCHISVNGVCMIGLAYTAELFGLPQSKNDLLHRGCLKGNGPITVIAGLYFCLLSKVSVGHMQRIALADITLLGFTERLRRSNVNLFSLQLEIDIPNISELVRLIEEFQAASPAEKLKEIFSLENLLILCSTILFIVKKTVPGSSTPINFTWGLFMLALNSAAVIEYCNALSELERDIELRDILYLLKFTTNLLTHGLNFSNSLEHFPLSLTSHHPTEEAPQVNPIEAVCDVVALLGPALTQETSAISISSGVSINSINMSNHGIKISSRVNTAWEFIENNAITVSSEPTLLNHHHHTRDSLHFATDPTNSHAPHAHEISTTSHMGNHKEKGHEDHTETPHHATGADAPPIPEADEAEKSTLTKNAKIKKYAGQFFNAVKIKKAEDQQSYIQGAGFQRF